MFRRFASVGASPEFCKGLLGGMWPIEAVFCCSRPPRRAAKDGFRILKGWSSVLQKVILGSSKDGFWSLDGWTLDSLQMFHRFASVGTSPEFCKGLLGGMWPMEAVFCCSRPPRRAAKDGSRILKGWFSVLQRVILGSSKNGFWSLEG